MNFGIPEKDRTQIKEAFSSLCDSFGNIWENIIDDKKEEKIKDLEKQIWNLEEEVQVLSKERENENDKLYRNTLETLEKNK